MLVARRSPMEHCTRSRASTPGSRPKSSLGEGDEPLDRKLICCSDFARTCLVGTRLDIDRVGDTDGRCPTLPIVRRWTNPAWHRPAASKCSKNLDRAGRQSSSLSRLNTGHDRKKRGGPFAQRRSHGHPTLPEGWDPSSDDHPRWEIPSEQRGCEAGAGARSVVGKKAARRLQAPAQTLRCWQIR